MNNSMEKADSLLNSIFSNLEDSMKNANKTFSVWKEVLLSIKSTKIDGSQLADHSRIIEIKNGILTVETDHPGRIQLFQLYKNYIQTGINKKLPDLEIKNIVFRLKRNQNPSNKKNIEEIIRENLLVDNIDDEFENKYPTKNNKKEELPEELKKIFERMKNYSKNES